VCAGLVFVGIAYLGAILPGLPTTPWLIAASYCFGRSSPRLHRWLLRSPFFGQLLQDWHTHRGIRKPTKMIACAVVILACTASITLASLSSSWRWLIAGLGTTGLCVILFLIPTIRPGAGPDPLP
jgi:uncharacterized membrane protein YbaN (DUF454 family)